MEWRELSFFARRSRQTAPRTTFDIMTIKLPLQLDQAVAAACLIRMTDLFEPCKVLTLDGDFQICRRYGRKVIPTISPR